MSRRCYLQEICNKFGDFYVAKASIDKEGNRHWSKWHTVLECWESDKGLQFLETVNNRTLLPCEIVLDMDDNISKKRMDQMCNALEQDGQSYCAYETGSKGYHIHLIDFDLAVMTKERRQAVRSIILRRYGFDMQKASDKAMIALEGVPHWKTGRIKKLVRSGGIWGDLLKR